jgi:hypothetical protein
VQIGGHLARVGAFYIRHLSTADRVGVELFQFKNQENPEDNFEYWKNRYLHLFVFKIQTWRSLLTVSSQQAAKNGWKTTLHLAKTPSGDLSIWKDPFAISLRYTAMSLPIACKVYAELES